MFGILLARQRSGTGALGNVIDRHPRLKYLGEVFHPDNIGQRLNYFTFLSEQVAEDPSNALPDSQIANFLAFMESVSEGSDAQIVDIKYSSLHHLNGAWHSPVGRPRILQHAREHNVPIIHLQRDNFVQTYVSGKLAEANVVWHARSHEEIGTTSLTIDPQRLIAYLHHTADEVARCKRWLRHHEPLVTIEYEEMFDQAGLMREDVCQQVSKLLGIGRFDQREPELVKQAPRSVSDAIQNFDEVKRSLATTKFAWMAE